MLLPTLTIQTGSATTPTLSTVIQAVWLALFIIFVFSVFAAGFTAKRIDNIHEPTYGKAVLATMLKNMTGLAGLFAFGLFFQAPVVVTLAVALCLIPILMYRMVFSCMWREAALIWLVATIVEGGLGYLLAIVGIVSWGVVTAT